MSALDYGHCALFERPTKSNARCACGIQSTRAISLGPGGQFRVYALAYVGIHTRGLSAVRLLLKARCPQGIIHCERDASRKRNVALVSDDRKVTGVRSEANGRSDSDKLIGTENAHLSDSNKKLDLVVYFLLIIHRY